MIGSRFTLIWRKSNEQVSPTGPGTKPMTKPVPAVSLEHSHRLNLGSPEFDALLNRITEGASDRERERTLPFPEIDLIRKARLGALRLPGTAGGAGSSIRELFEIVIRLGEADANVA